MDHRLNVKCKSYNFLEENIGKNLHDNGFDDKLLDKKPKVSFIKKNDKVDFVKIKNICFAKMLLPRERKDKPQAWRKIWKSHI